MTTCGEGAGTLCFPFFVGWLPEWGRGLGPRQEQNGPRFCLSFPSFQVKPTEERRLGGELWPGAAELHSSPCEPNLRHPRTLTLGGEDTGNRAALPAEGGTEVTESTQKLQKFLHLFRCQLPTHSSQPGAAPSSGQNDVATWGRLCNKHKSPSLTGNGLRSLQDTEEPQ